MTQQAFFGFLVRPFQAPPQDDLFVPLEPIVEAIRQLHQAAVKGDGIGVLTATPGSGKTVVCRQVRARLESDFATVLLPSCSFPTRRSMLQSILHGMGREYTGLTEQESQVVMYVMLAETSKLIAYRLGLSTSRVSALLKSAMYKLSVNSRAELVQKLSPLGVPAAVAAAMDEEPAA